MKETVLIFNIILITIISACNTGKNSTEEITGGDNFFTPPTLPDSIYNQLKPGDIIIRKGNGPLSAHIMINTKEEYTHCGIIVKEGEKWRVIHTIGGTSSDEGIDGVQLIDLDKFVKFSADSMCFISRPVFADSLDTKIPAKAYEYLDKQYPFDHRFSLYSPEKLYCSELLFYVFKDVNQGKNVFEVKKKHKSYMLMFSTFFDTTKFTPIFHLKDDNRKLM